jgi:hypothetical protein
MMTELVVPFLIFAVAAAAKHPKQSGVRAPQGLRLLVSQLGLQSAPKFVVCGHCAPPRAQSVRNELIAAGVATQAIRVMTNLPTLDSDERSGQEAVLREFDFADDAIIQRTP